MEVKTELKTVRVEMTCDETLGCDGFMISDGTMLFSNPPRYPHACTKCGARANLDKKYPAIEYENN